MGGWRRRYDGPARTWRAVLVSSTRLHERLRPEVLRLAVSVAVLGTAVPLLILTIHTMKSPVVGVILLPGLVWAILAPLAATAEVWHDRPWILRSAAVATLMCGFLNELNAASRPGPYARSGDDVPKVMNALADLIDACETKGLDSPVLFTDAVTPYFQTSVVQVTEFEQRGRWRNYRDAGVSIFAGEEEAHFKRLTQSDVVVLGGMPVGSFKFPYDVKLEAMRPRLRAYCDAHFLKLGEYRTGGRVVTLYIRGSLRAGRGRQRWLDHR